MKREKIITKLLLIFNKELFENDKISYELYQNMEEYLLKR